jgi:hypothetical protein
MRSLVKYYAALGGQVQVHAGFVLPWGRGLRDELYTGPLRLLLNTKERS